MPIVFGVIGVLLIVAGVRGTTSQLFSLVKSDFSGQPNYFEWMIAIFLVGAIGYVKQLSTISRMMMILVAAGLLYKNKQVFSETKTETVANPTTSTQASTATQQTSSPLPQLPTLQQDETNMVDL